MSRLFTKRLSKEIALYEETNFKFPNLILRPTDNLSVWYYIVYDLQDTPFSGGVYYGKVKLPSEYPLKPPDFYIYTPNGRFETGVKICTSFSGFHQDTYSSSWNIMTMLEGLISFMTDTNDTHGIGELRTPNETKVSLASASLNWNKNNGEFMKIFPDIDTLL